jgi:hypothetical protein
MVSQTEMNRSPAPALRLSVRSFHFKIGYMHTIRSFAAAALILMFISSTYDLSVFDGSLMTARASPVLASCPMHAVKCCCPEACNAFLNSSNKKGRCHSKGATHPLSMSAAQACFLKSGCGQRDAATHPGSLLEDFLPEGVERLDLLLNVSLLPSSTESFRLCTSPSALFHPPRSV